MRYAFSLIFFTCLFYSAKAQFADTAFYYLNHSSTASLNQTNSGRGYSFNNNLRFSINKKRVSINTVNNWIYARQLAVITNNDYSSAVDFNLFKSLDRLYYWGLATYDKSLSLKINNRFQSGIGVGYNLIDRKNISVVVSDGILYEKTDIFIKNANETYDVVRNSFRVKHKFQFLNNRVTIDGIHFLQNSLTLFEDYLLKSNATATLKLNTWLNFTITATYNKLNITQRENVLLQAGLSIEKRF